MTHSLPLSRVMDHMSFGFSSLLSVFANITRTITRSGKKEDPVKNRYPSVVTRSQARALDGSS